jgi:DNA polymerase alpha subunit A
MADLLGEVDANVPTRVAAPKAVKSETRRKVRVLSPPLTSHKKSANAKKSDDARQQFDTPIADSTFDDDNGILGDDDFQMGDALPSSPVANAVERKSQAAVKVEEEDDDDLMEVAQAVVHEGSATASVNMTGTKPVPKMKPIVALPTPENSSPTMPAADTVDASTWNNITSKLNVLSSPATEAPSYGKLRPQDALEEDGSLRMFWLDYTEVNGSLCLFGKVKNKKTGMYVSAFVKVDNILRKLFFLPREYRQSHGRDTDEEVEMKDVYEEVDDLMTKLGVGMHKIKPCSRKYAFELPDIPKEADYLKLFYPYDKPPLPMDKTGETYSHVFGTTTALFEQFVLWKNIMGPCWLNIEDADFTAVNNASWCKLELAVPKPAAITVLSDSENMETPPMTLMSLSFRTQLNVKENKQEILVASARVYENVSLTETMPPEKLPCKMFTVMRPSDPSFPMGFEAETKKQRGTFMLAKSEQFLLSMFLALFEKTDPDVLMGHQLQEVDYSILLSRMREKKTPGWHRIGRLKRSEWPKVWGKSGAGFFAERQLVSGRLMCDVANDMGKVFSYSL